MIKKIYSLLVLVLLFNLLPLRTCVDDSKTSNFHFLNIPKESNLGESDLLALPPILDNPGNSVETNFNMRDYFRYLNEYLPYNQKGSCGYISLIAVLSYYDAFFNDNIIPEVYERKKTDSTNIYQAKFTSPGVRREVFDSISDIQYMNHIRTTYTIDLQSRFMKEYADNFYQDFKINNYDFHTTDISFAFSIGNSELESVVDIFYNDEDFCDFNYFDFDANENDPNLQTLVENFIKSEIDAGNPVILHVADHTGEYNEKNEEIINYHSIIAYDYDSNSIYSHYGWSSADNHIDVYSYGYDEIYFAASLNFNINHTHGNNYLVNNINYCGCNYHSHTLSYTSNGSTGHFEYCSICQYRKNNLHSISSTSLENDVCIHCGYIVDLINDTYITVD